ncbi:MAG: hypothetical protein US86_C0005G0034 [Candidatus Daviesbacteria bacterium GW2011_GWA2_38_24]|uniref:Prepilin-type N-terminal cleavage/methylation domain-containing protein n=1 Tax=Candidatus Daviesbacteria bacterium GW2011_GWA2_38_24 TaxID=1618422 RepID=A0A0G0JFH4_9BACT|nr:MAG: hypothetical protein US86_C0005G0034 [Candidatus Daviesbacteria bacterium GW2011_GWA2_38_24]KKQ78594.1 MAG: hypothetical protein UT01_C0065G0008 [Candidatus Daviesbacteria bacterium GW2011_GWA1_38_7]
MKAIFKSSDGISAMEVILVCLIIGFLILIIGNLPNSIKLIGESNRSSLAKDILLKKIEDIRSTSFDSLASSTTISDPRMNKLSDASGSITVEDCPLTVCKNGEEDDVKQVTLEITWQDGTQTKQSKLTTLVSKNGL